MWVWFYDLGVLICVSILWGFSFVWFYLGLGREIYKEMIVCLLYKVGFIFLVSFRSFYSK